MDLSKQLRNKMTKNTIRTGISVHESIDIGQKEMVSKDGEISNLTKKDYENGDDLDYLLVKGLSISQDATEVEASVESRQ
jgi:hypothetical protein